MHGEGTIVTFFRDGTYAIAIRSGMPVASAYRSKKEKGILRIAR